MQIILRDRERFVVEAVDRPKRKFNLEKIAGSARNLRYIKPEDRIFEEGPSLLGRFEEDRDKPAK